MHPDLNDRDRTLRVSLNNKTHNLVIKVTSPAFAHCSDTTQGSNQALNFFAHHNNFTKVPKGINRIANKPMEMTNDLYTAGAWAMMSVLLLIFVSILLSRDSVHMSWSNSQPDLKMEEEERIPLLAQEEKSV
ncbi:uncharacterized protein EAE97_005234 [Botrytis byssoidea]|uniref:Uncharacterized protein n=1 Tax=Botrytis byssoidea TaxID=139641 RepID=A0A9P5IPT3_9HELO|nr:uncharacterized protein EAE97_005234 [Botrytis byssoidea]KAF7944601.1 hypothetical protein EAE97_005234 [Botrytis byssoidea]